MKLSLLTTTLAIITLSVEPKAIGQTYALPTEYLSFGVQLQGLGQATSRRVGGVILDEFVTIDTGNNTMRRVGTLSVPSFQLANITFVDTQFIPPPPPEFPNPPTPGSYVSGELTISSFSSTGVSFPFDTGFQPFTWDSGFNAYLTTPSYFSLALPVSLSQSLETGGVTYSETQSFAINNFTFGWASWVIGTDNYPESIQLPPPNFLWSDWVALSSFTAPNGFSASAGVTLVPEPQALTLIGSGCVIIGFLRRKEWSVR